MPRTRAKAKTAKVDGSSKKLLVQYLKDEEEKFIAKNQEVYNKAQDRLTDFWANLRMKIPKEALHLKFDDIENGLVDLSVVSQVNSVLASTLCGNSLSKTRIGKQQRAKRSLSATSCSTVDSGRGTTSGNSSGNNRVSRARVRANRSRLGSRSVTRDISVASNYQTPSNSSTSLYPLAGSITPKHRPNEPLMLMRRPKAGEFAWSNQGSPLMTAGASGAPEIAVNIPIGDNVMALLPTRGAIHPENLPEVDANVCEKLKILRDNLIKICSNMSK